MVFRPDTVVIGAGPAGLATLKALADQGLAAICFDAGQRPGGLWNLGAPGSSAYRTLHLNTSRSRTEFADFPMPSHWPAYPSLDQMSRYLGDYATRFGLGTAIRPSHTVTAVRRLPDGTFQVRANGPDGEVEVITPAVIVASGHNSVPRLPEPRPEVPAGIHQLHSHDYRDPDQLAGRRVLVVGGGNSAMDIAVDSSYSAASTLLSLRHGVWIVPKFLLGRPSDTLNGALARQLPWRVRQRISETLLRISVGAPGRHGLPAPSHGFLQDHPTLSDGLLSRINHGRIAVRPAIADFAEQRVRFVDGSEDEVDLVVWCTGYTVDIPYLDKSLVDNNPEELALYRHVFAPDTPGLMFVGLMQSTGSALPVVEAQARLAAAYLAGEYALPPVDEQRRDCRAELRRATRRWAHRRPAMRIDFDGYLVQAARELVQGRRRQQRGHGLTVDKGPTVDERSDERSDESVEGRVDESANGTVDKGLAVDHGTGAA